MDTKIKVCDIRDVAAARFCADNQVDFIGLHQIYAPITQEKINLFYDIKEVSGSMKLVLVTRESNIERLVDICTSFPFDYIQMHFPASADVIRQFVKSLRENGCGSGIIAVVGAKDIDSVDIQKLSEEADYLLFDSSYHGGTGTCAPEEVMHKIKSKCDGIQYFFAGGLNAGNVWEKIRIMQPFAVDVQSGVEADGRKHVKDHTKILNFIKAVKGK